MQTLLASLLSLKTFGSHANLDTSVDGDEDLSSDCEDEEGEDGDAEV